MALSTLKEVAQVAGVSKSTVSRVINRSSRVAPDVAQNVLETMKRVGFEPAVNRPGPKLGARRVNRTRGILLMLVGTRISAGHENSGYPAVLRGIEQVISRHNVKLELAGSMPDEPLPTSLVRGDVDGVLLMGRDDALHPEAIAHLKKLPAVGLLRDFAALGDCIDRVTYNNHKVGAVAAHYLLERGHRRLALFNSDPDHPAFKVRVREFAAAAQRAGADVQLLQSDHRPETLRDHHETFRGLVSELLAGAAPATGLFVTADYQLPLLYEVLREQGVTPGAAFEVISCDAASQFLDMFQPRPASIDINLELIGAEGVRVLQWRVQQPSGGNRISITIEPRLRASM